MQLVGKDGDEIVILVTLIGLSAVMFVASYDFPREAALFPRFAAAITFVGAFLLLVEPYLPPALQTFVGESMEFFADDEVREYASSKEDAQSSAEDTESSEEFFLNDSAVTAIAIVLYAIVSYLIGMLWSTPLFVFAYLLLFGVSPLISVVLAGVTFGIAYAFMDILNVAMDTGALM